MPTTAIEPKPRHPQRAELGPRTIPCAWYPLLALALVARGRLPATSERSGAPRSRPNAKSEEGKTAGITVMHPEKRDIRMTVVQPGTIQAYEVAPIFSRIAGYVEKYNFNIGDRVKPGDVLLDMWIPDLVEQLGQKSAAVKRAEVQIRVTESALRAAEAKVETARARVALGRSRRQAGPGQLRPVGFGVQAARDSGQTASPGRPGP